MDDAVLLALEHLVDATRTREKFADDLGRHLKQMRGKEEFPGLLAQVRDSGAVSMTELAKIAGISRGYLYELLAAVDRERER